ncbi:MAG TPA: hypothetical protein VKY79_04115 [Actinomycetaceae bacterium]|nr:hypothetical protein [Actinomycetaceae bacterium]
MLSTAALPYSLEITPELEEFVTGTLSLDQDASSLVGDGLSSCAFSFDAEETDRSRSIILATDNQVIGEPIYSLQEAVDVTADRGIGLYGLFIASGDAYSADAYEQAITNRGGAFYYADDPSAIDAIIDSITSEQAQTLEATHEVVIIERPEAVLWIAVIGVAGIIFIRWRLGS